MEKDRSKYELLQLGERLRSIRLKKNMTQVDLEIRSGINNGDISRIESGQKNIEFYTLVKLVEALEIELVDLFRKK